MTPLALPLLLLCLGLLALPGLTLWLALMEPEPERPAGRLADGVCFGLALGTCGVYALAWAGLGTALAGWGAASLAAAAALAARRWRQGLHLPSGEALAGASWLAGVLGLALALRLLPAFFHAYPHGWDPYFHLLLAHKILLAGGHIHDWLPFEDIPLRYPTGSHVLLALLSRAAGAPLHDVFKVLLALAGALTCLQVHALVAAATRQPRLALLSAAAYALLPALGSLDYYRWGGLPNLLGMYFLLGALSALCGPRRRRLRWLLPAFFSAICLVNHHVLLTAALCLAAVLAYLALAPDRRPRAVELLWGAALSALPVSLYMGPRLWGGGSLGETGLFSYGEPLHTPAFIASSVGHGYLGLALLGLGAHLLGGPRRAGAVDGVLLVSLAAALALFAGFEYGGRALMRAYLGRDIAPFTASRFLTDAVALAAVFPGLALARALDLARRPSPGPALVAVLLLSLENAPLYCGYFKAEIEPARLAAYRYIRRNTPPETVVLDRHVHAPYLCWRVASNTPIPTSEPWARAVKQQTMAAILEGRLPPAAMKAPVVLVSGLTRGKLLWQDPQGKVKVSLVYGGPSPVR